ncbi:lactonase family protein [Novosphingobium resinovorum]|uniref:lactonase family protein n=1 Tax=Novosphingobium resinovorum TaxID=158500 RepID=UPI003618BBD3
MIPKTSLALGIAGLTLACCQTVSGVSSDRTLAFIGTQEAGQGQGIVAVRLDRRTGALTSLGTAATVERPTWVLADPAHRRLFAVSEVGNDGASQGAVLAFGYDPASGALTAEGRAASGGGGPTHLALGAAGRQVFVANYGSGQVAAIPVAADGSLSPGWVAAHEGSGPHRRQKGPHAHGVTVDPSGRWVLSPDLGTDRVYIHAVAGGAATSATLPPGSGPRHIVFAPDGRHAFLMTEMAGTIFSFAWDAVHGRLTELSHLALDGPDFAGAPSGSELAVSRDGRFLYAGNRAGNRIQVYAIGAGGVLTMVQGVDCGGQVPWGFALDGSGKWLVVANQGSGNLAVFAVDPKSGRLDLRPAHLDIAKPTSVAFVGP